MLKVLFIGCTFLYLTSIYSFIVTGINGNQIDFNDFRDKKILIVNIATGSPRVGQLQKLEQLYQIYKDSLIIIVFPSNSFGNEIETNASINTFITNNYNPHFLLGAKIDVTGSGQAPVYQWLTLQSQNGMMSNAVQGDFQKFLINKDGKLIGVFSPMVDPMDSSIQNIISDN
jgi:glutathione peroxidase